MPCRKLPAYLPDSQQFHPQQVGVRQLGKEPDHAPVKTAACVFRSNDYVKKCFKQHYGMTPYAYYLEPKLTHAKHLLQQTNLPVSQIADRLGCKSDCYFPNVFGKLCACPPHNFASSTRKKRVRRMNHVICIDSVQALQQLHQPPHGHFRLCADIDLEGALWQPVDFYGSLDGNGRTISNYRIVSSTVRLTQNRTYAIMEYAKFTALDKDRFNESPKQDCYARITVRDVDLQEHKATFAALPKGSYT